MHTRGDWEQMTWELIEDGEDGEELADRCRAIAKEIAAKEPIEDRDQADE